MANEVTNLLLLPSSSDQGTRLDVYLANEVHGWSRSRLRRLIDGGSVLVNDRDAKPSYRLHSGDRIDVELNELPGADFEPEDIPLDIVYEDQHLAVINKPAGMVVHPGAGVTGGTLANAIAYHFSSVPLQRSQNSGRVGIVHRLDKDTSGLIVVAKNEETAEELSRQFHDREVGKSYLVLVHGAPEDDSGKIEMPIARDRRHRTRMAVVGSGGRKALTLWHVKRRLGKFTLLDVDIKTGRTHQIRVHLASIGHPVVGDATYNAGRDKTVADVRVRDAIARLNRFFLHSHRLEFTHPGTGKRLVFVQHLPPELVSFLDVLLST